jgi:hypothetical protein
MYCDAAMANCGENLAVYESESDCMAACQAFPLGAMDNRVENTIGCRNYHARASSQDPETHCDHAGPTGDGHCGTALGEKNTGTCESYCRLLSEGCSTEFDAEFTDLAACVDACSTTFEDSGAGNDTYYTTGTARDENSLQCRVYYAVKASAGDAEACEKAVFAGDCD